MKVRNCHTGSFQDSDYSDNTASPYQERGENNSHIHHAIVHIRNDENDQNISNHNPSMLDNNSGLTSFKDDGARQTEKTITARTLKQKEHEENNSNIANSNERIDTLEVNDKSSSSILDNDYRQPSNQDDDAGQPQTKQTKNPGQQTENIFCCARIRSFFPFQHQYRSLSKNIEEDTSSNRNVSPEIVNQKISLKLKIKRTLLLQMSKSMYVFTMVVIP